MCSSCLFPWKSRSNSELCRNFLSLPTRHMFVHFGYKTPPNGSHSNPRLMMQCVQQELQRFFSFHLCISLVVLKFPLLLCNLAPTWEKSWENRVLYQILQLFAYFSIKNRGVVRLFRVFLLFFHQKLEDLQGVCFGGDPVSEGGRSRESEIPFQWRIPGLLLLLLLGRLWCPAPGMSSFARQGAHGAVGCSGSLCLLLFGASGVTLFRRLGLGKNDQMGNTLQECLGCLAVGVEHLHLGELPPLLSQRGWGALVPWFLG